MIERTSTGEYRIIARIRLNGRIVERRQTVKASKEEAKRIYERLKDEMRCGGSPDGSLILTKEVSTFGDCIAIYRDYLKLAGKLSRFHALKIDRVKRELGSISLNDFADRFDVWLKLECLVARNRWGKPIPGRNGSSAAKRNRYIEIVRAAFNKSIELKKLSVNPIDRIRFPKQKQIARDEYMTVDQMRMLLEKTQKERPHIYPILKFALQVPCRKSELVNATIDDLDLFSNTIRIRNGQSKNDQGNYKPIPPNMLDYFRNLPKDTRWLFYRRDDDGVCRPLGSFRRAYKHCLRAAGLDDGYTFHCTRHISATYMVDRGTPERVVMMVANWKTNMLSNYYHRQPKSAHQLIKWDDKCEGDVKAAKRKNG